MSLYHLTQHLNQDERSKLAQQHRSVYDAVRSLVRHEQAKAPTADAYDGLDAFKEAQRAHLARLRHLRAAMLDLTEAWGELGMP